MRTIKPPLGGVSVEQFMRRHWQRRPLLIRAALPDVSPPLSPEALFELASRDDVESRLVSQRARRWQLARGPFDPDDLPPRTRRAWSLLVQGVEQTMKIQNGMEILQEHLVYAAMGKKESLWKITG